MSMEALLTQWNKATGDLQWGVQRVFKDVLDLAAEGKTHLVHGADYYHNMPCLVNTVGGMLTSGGGAGVPMANFETVVSLFDKINREFENMNINTEVHMVSETAAETLSRYFAPVKDKPPVPLEMDGPPNERYVEPTDEAMAEAMVNIFSADSHADFTVVPIIDNEELAVGKLNDEDYLDRFAETKRGQSGN